MINFTLRPALLWIFCWISVSVSEFHTLEVRSGEEVTLLCSNLTVRPTHIFWFLMAGERNISRISSMAGSESNVTNHDGFPKGKFRMTSNLSQVFLTIKSVDSSDSGLYFCGRSYDGCSTIFSATHLKVREACDVNWMSVTLFGLTVVLVMIIISLVVQIRKYRAAKDKGQTPQHNEDPEALTYSALTFHHSRRATERQSEPHVVYAATR